MIVVPFLICNFYREEKIFLTQQRGFCKNRKLNGLRIKTLTYLCFPFNPNRSARLHGVLHDKKI